MLKKFIWSFRSAIVNIKSNLLRTLLSILGIVIGVAALVVILSLIDGMEKYALNQISSTTSLEAIYLETQNFEEVDGIRMRKDSLNSIGYLDYLKMLDEIELDGKGYLLYAEKSKIYSNGRSVGGIGRYINDAGMFDYKLLEGEIPGDGNLTAISSIAVINTKLANALFPNDSLSQVIGKKIIFNKSEMLIMAVIETEENENASFFAPYTTLGKDYLNRNDPKYLIRAAHVKNVTLIKENVEKWLKKHLGEKHDMTVLTNEFRVNQVNKGFLLFRVIMGMIVGISVVVGGIGIMNVMIISVTERIKEIGIRKAIGAKRKMILIQFLSESITISVLGSFLGLVVGIAFTMAALPIVKMLTKIPFQAAFTLNTLLVISVIAIAVGVIFGTYPAIKASKLNPVDAIRHE